ncbi:hypothetical protein C414_000260153 [Campylobacter jejuni subsp. jejuni 414]|nr:hypothetical protein C414_000260153 [Campylobacter jejuni subsp. jejuni 414]
MKRVVFKCCLSGSVFYKKGDEVLLEDSEALRLLEKGIVEFKEVLKEQQTQEQEEQEQEEEQTQDKKGKKGKK